MFDYLIRNAAVLDGSGSDPYTADVALSGGTIAALWDIWPVRPSAPSTRACW